MKNIIVMVISSLVFLCIGILGTRYYYNNNECTYLQNGFDSIFMSNFSLLCSNLNEDISRMDESQIEHNNIENVEYSYTMRAIFTFTSYANNDDLNYIVSIIDDMTGSNARFEMINDPKVIEQLTYLRYHMDSEETASNLHKDLSNSIKELKTYN